MNTSKILQSQDARATPSRVPHVRLGLMSLSVVLLASVACGEESTTERLGLDDPLTVSELDLDRYLGAWAEIASFPNPFQEGCANTTATYSTRDDGNIDVLNECTVDGEPTVANGTARPVDVNRGKLEVSFFGPFFGDYWVIELGESNDDEPYPYAVVASPTRDYLWILSRTPTLPQTTIDGILERAEAQSFDTSRLGFTDQSDSPL